MLPRKLFAGGVLFRRGALAVLLLTICWAPCESAHTESRFNRRPRPETTHHPPTMTEPTSFASFVKETREKKKNEALAQQFLGGSRGRKATTSGAGAAATKRNESEKPTLLSRISGAGVQKRSSSAKPAGSIEGKWQHDLHKLNNPNGPPTAKGQLNRTVSASQVDRNSRTYDKFASVLNRNASMRNNDTPGFNIRGVATGGPYTVIASNFAPGTTAADIEAVMSPHGGDTLGCRLISASPTVMVELRFADKAGAENVIATFNNQKVGVLQEHALGMTDTSNRLMVGCFTYT